MWSVQSRSFFFSLKKKEEKRKNKNLHARQSKGPSSRGKTKISKKSSGRQNHGTLFLAGQKNDCYSVLHRIKSARLFRARNASHSLSLGAVPVGAGYYWTQVEYSEKQKPQLIRHFFFFFFWFDPLLSVFFILFVLSLLGVLSRSRPSAELLLGGFHCFGLCLPLQSYPPPRRKNKKVTALFSPTYLSCIPPYCFKNFFFIVFFSRFSNCKLRIKR